MPFAETVPQIVVKVGCLDTYLRLYAWRTHLKCIVDLKYTYKISTTEPEISINAIHADDKGICQATQDLLRAGIFRSGYNRTFILGEFQT
jgi:hypothetical protein